MGSGDTILGNDVPFSKTDRLRRLGRYGTCLVRFFTRWIHPSDEPFSRT